MRKEGKRAICGFCGGSLFVQPDDTGMLRYQEQHRPWSTSGRRNMCTRLRSIGRSPRAHEGERRLVLLARDELETRAGVIANELVERFVGSAEDVDFEAALICWQR